jgi:hypothetical protein
MATTGIKRYKVIDGPLTIRKEADGATLPTKLAQGDEIEVIGEHVNKGGYNWVQHTAGWSALSDDDETEVYMLDISNRDPNAPRIFRVWAATISIRETPNGKRLAEKLFKKTEITVEPQSRTEAGGYTWWKHSKGWSAERSSNGYEVFLKEVFDSPAGTGAKPAVKVTLPATWQGIMPLQVAQDVKVRGEPTTDSRALVIRSVKRGLVLNCDVDKIVEADGWYWTRHELGWSAIKSLDGKTTFLAEPGSIPGLVAIGPDGPKAEDLPGYRQLITRSPVDMTDIGWFQYYGNNMFAMRNGKKYGYDRYSQALHGGLDYGNSDKAGIKVYAGMEAEFLKTEYPSPNNTRTFLKKDDYIIIYQHITNARAFKPGDMLTPDTVIGEIEHHSINNGWDHLHFEIRFMTEWIVNPLVLFTPAMFDEIILRFDPMKPNTGYAKDFPESTLNFFYKCDKWSKWTTPLEQPMLNLYRSPIGPRYELQEQV